MKSQSKKIWIIGVTIFLTLILIYVQYYSSYKSFPGIEDSYVVELENFGGSGVLSSDGSKLFSSFTKFDNLENGEIQDNIAAFESHAPGVRNFLSVSPDNRFITAGDMYKNYFSQ